MNCFITRAIPNCIFDINFVFITDMCIFDDDSLVSIQPSPLDPFATTYINASAVHDSDPKQAAYIATQSPLPSTITDFWQMVWEQVIFA